MQTFKLKGWVRFVNNHLVIKYCLMQVIFFLVHTELINWPEKDLSELFRRMETSLPETDTLAYSTRVEKLNWDDVRTL